MPEKTASKTRLKTAVIAMLCLFFSLCPLANAGIGLGISPASITISDAFKGGTYERSITIFNTGDEPGNFILTAEGECSGWIFYYDEDEPETLINEITIAGKDKTKILVKFDIPEDIANGDYTSTIYAQSIPDEDEVQGAVAHTVIRIPSEVLIQVTGTQILKGIVKDITMMDTEIGNPLKRKGEFQNEGNVIAKPKIAVSITKDGELVDSIVHDKTGIKPDTTDTITVLRNTTGMGTGDYIANIDVSLADDVLASKTLPFKILPFGTLTRRGALHSLSIEGEPRINVMIKLCANFENTGEIDTMAKFKGEVYYEDNFIDVLESDEMFIETGEIGKLTSYYKIMSPGNYAVKGHVIYAGKETQVKDVSFDVSGLHPEEKKETAGFGFLISIFSVITVFFLVTKKRRRER